MLDRVFKVGLLLIGLSILFELHEGSHAPRYQFIVDRGDPSVGNIVFDSWTGTEYLHIKAREGLKPMVIVFDPVHGKVNTLDAPLVP